MLSAAPHNWNYRTIVWIATFLLLVVALPWGGTSDYVQEAGFRIHLDHIPNDGAAPAFGFDRTGLFILSGFLATLAQNAVAGSIVSLVTLACTAVAAWAQRRFQDSWWISQIATLLGVWGGLSASGAERYISVPAASALAGLLIMLSSYASGIDLSWWATATRLCALSVVGFLAFVVLSAWFPSPHILSDQPPRTLGVFLDGYADAGMRIAALPYASTALISAALCVAVVAYMSLITSQEKSG